MTQIAITDIGTNAAIAVMEGGYKLSVATFKLGDAFGYTPLQSDTALHGATVYTAAITEIIKTNPKEVTFKVVLGSNVGPFNYGEIGLYLATGELFALVTLDTLRSKQATTGADKGDTFRINIPITLDNVLESIEFTEVSVVQTELAEVESVNALPEANSAPANTYLITNTHQKRRTVAVSAALNNKWYFLDYNPLVEGVVTASTPGVVTFTFNGNLPTMNLVGDYILQGSSGSLVSQAVLALTMVANSDTQYTFTYDVSVVGFALGSTVQVWIHNALVSGLMYQYYATKDWSAGAWSYGNFVLKDDGLYLGKANNIQPGDVPGVSAKWLPIMDFTSPLAAARLTGTILDARLPSNIVRKSRLINTTGMLTGGGSLATDLTLTVNVATTPEANAGVINTAAMSPLTTKQSILTQLGLKSVTGTGLATGGGTLDANRTINVPAASTVEARAGVLATKVITPATLKDMIDYRLLNLSVTGTGLATGGGTLDVNRTINVPAATNAQALAGVNATVVITPPTLNYAVSTIMQAKTVTGSGLATGGGSLSNSQVITVTAATVQEAVDGVLDTKVITPKTAQIAASQIWSDLTIVTSGGITFTKNVIPSGVTPGLLLCELNLEFESGVLISNLQELTEPSIGILTKLPGNTVATRKLLTVAPTLGITVGGVFHNIATDGGGVKILAVSNAEDGDAQFGNPTVTVDASVLRTFGYQKVAGTIDIVQPTIPSPGYGNAGLRVGSSAVDLGGIEIYRDQKNYLKLTSGVNGNLFRSVTSKATPVTLTITVEQLDVSGVSVIAKNFLFTSDGNLVADKFVGNGAGVTGLNAGNLDTGTVPLARLPIATQLDAEHGLLDSVLMTPLKTSQHIASKLATSSDATTATDLNKLMTPYRTSQLLEARFDPMLLARFDQHMAKDGYTRLPNGLLIQWGFPQGNLNDHYQEIVFPIAYNENVFSVMITDWCGDTTLSTGHIVGHSVRATTNTGFHLMWNWISRGGNNNISNVLYWMSIGR